MIQDRSGHRSLDGLRKYERVSEEQQASACSSLIPTSSTSSDLLATAVYFIQWCTSGAINVYQAPAQNCVSGNCKFAVYN